MRRSKAGGSNHGPTVFASCSQRSTSPATPTVSMNDSAPPVWGRKTDTEDGTDVDAGLCRHLGDAGAQHPELAHAARFDAFRPPRQLVRGTFVDEQGADHVPVHQVQRQLHEVPRLDVERPVHGQLKMDALSGRRLDETPFDRPDSFRHFTFSGEI